MNFIIAALRSMWKSLNFNYCFGKNGILLLMSAVEWWYWYFACLLHVDFGSKLFAMKLVVLLKHSYPALAWRSWKSILLIRIIMIIFGMVWGLFESTCQLFLPKRRVWLTSSNIGRVNISSSPFFFLSDWDRFISVSCDNLVLMTGINPMVVVGCKLRW